LAGGVIHGTIIAIKGDGGLLTTIQTWRIRSMGQMQISGSNFLCGGVEKWASVVSWAFVVDWAFVVTWAFVVKWAFVVCSTLSFFTRHQGETTYDDSNVRPSPKVIVAVLHLCLSLAIIVTNTFPQLQCVRL
jgi:hypothetical protein